MPVIKNGIQESDTQHNPQVASATLALTTGTVADVFTVRGGPVQLLGLFTHITTVVSNDACDFKWQSDPTSGAANTDLSGVVDIDSAAVGDVVYITGASAGVQVIAANGTAVALSCATPAFLLPGGVDANLANADPTTGAATVYLFYRPLVSGASVS